MSTVGRGNPDCGGRATGRLGQLKRHVYLGQGAYLGAFAADIERWAIILWMEAGWRWS